MSQNTFLKVLCKRRAKPCVRHTVPLMEVNKRNVKQQQRPPRCPPMAPVTSALWKHHLRQPDGVAGNSFPGKREKKNQRKNTCLGSKKHQVQLLPSRSAVQNHSQFTGGGAAGAFFLLLSLRREWDGEHEALQSQELCSFGP